MATESNKKPFGGSFRSRILTILFILDTSVSMAKDKIASVYQAVEGVIEYLKKNPSFHSEFRVNVLYFDKEASWLSEEPKKLEDFELDKRPALGTGTYFECAYKSLYKAMHDKTVFPPDEEYSAPVIYFLTDGFENGNHEELEQTLKTLNNSWRFQKAIKGGLAIGEDADRRTVEAFVGNKDNVFPVRNDMLDKLVGIIRETALKLVETQLNGTDATNITQTAAIQKDEEGYVVAIDDSSALI